MKIVIDARESGTSTGRYVDKLIEYLHKLQPAHEIIVLTKPHRMEFMAKVAPSFQAIESPYKEFTFAEQLAFKKQLDGLKADLVHFSMTQQPIWYKGKAVTTIHDLTTIRFINPDKNPLVFRLKREVYKYVIKKVAAKSLRIMTPSEFVKADVAQFAAVSPDKITVTYEAADKVTSQPEPLEALKGKQFIMYVGRPTPHKNLERLIDAFVQLQAKHPDLWLVLVGKMDNNYRRIQAGIQARQLTNIYFSDFMDDNGLRWLYESCSVYVFPSLSEGFGLPGLEAMVHGAPVASSNATCLPEIYGDAAHYFDPLDVQAITNAINDVLTDKNLRDDLIKKGYAQAAKYSWQRMAEQTLAIYLQA